MRKVTYYLFFAGSALFLLYACTKTGVFYHYYRQLGEPF